MEKDAGTECFDENELFSAVAWTYGARQYQVLHLYNIQER